MARDLIATRSAPVAVAAYLAHRAEQVLATASLPRRTGRGMESEAAAADRGATDRTIVAVLFQGGLRRSEAAALRWADVQDAADGRGIVVYVRRSKTDQDGTAADVRYLKNGCAVALRQLRDRRTVQRSGLRPEPTDQVLGGLNGQSIARRLTAAARAPPGTLRASNTRPAALPSVRRHRPAARSPAAGAASICTASGTQPGRASSNTTAPTASRASRSAIPQPWHVEDPRAGTAPRRAAGPRSRRRSPGRGQQRQRWHRRGCSPAPPLRARRLRVGAACRPVPTMRMHQTGRRTTGHRAGIAPDSCAPAPSPACSRAGAGAGHASSPAGGAGERCPRHPRPRRLGVAAPVRPVPAIGTHAPVSAIS